MIKVYEDKIYETVFEIAEIINHSIICSRWNFVGYWICISDSSYYSSGTLWWKSHFEFFLFLTSQLKYIFRIWISIWLQQNSWIVWIRLKLKTSSIHLYFYYKKCDRMISRYYRMNISMIYTIDTNWVFQTLSSFNANKMKIIFLCNSNNTKRKFLGW